MAGSLMSQVICVSGLHADMYAVSYFVIDSDLTS